MKKIASLLLIFVLIFSFCSIQVSALDLGNVPAFNDISTATDDNSLFLRKEYRNGYSLDTEKLGILDALPALINMLANLLFGLQHILGLLTVTLFRFTMTFDISNFFGSSFNGILKNIKKTLFDGLFLWAMIPAFVYIIQKFVQRNMQEYLSQFLKIICIIAVSFVLVEKGTEINRSINTLTTGVSLQLLGSISGNETFIATNGSTGVQAELEDYADKTAGLLWGSLVHQPWEALEFGEVELNLNQKATHSKAILSKKDSKDRAKYFVDHPEITFSKEGVTGRLVMALVFLIVAAVKCGLFLFIAIIRLGFQAMTQLFILIGPIFLLMSLAPALGGMQRLYIWIGKIVEFQLNSLVLMFFLGFIVLIDKNMFASTNTTSWLILSIVETGVAVFAFTKRHELLKALGIMQKAIRNPQPMLRMVNSHMDSYQNSGNVYSSLEQYLSRIESRLAAREKVNANFSSLSGAGLATAGIIYNSHTSSPPPDERFMLPAAKKEHWRPKDIYDRHPDWLAKHPDYKPEIIYGTELPERFRTIRPSAKQEDVPVFSNSVAKASGTAQSAPRKPYNVNIEPSENDPAFRSYSSPVGNYEGDSASGRSSADRPLSPRPNFADALAKTDAKLAAEKAARIAAKRKNNPAAAGSAHSSNVRTASEPPAPRSSPTSYAEDVPVFSPTKSRGKPPTARPDSTKLFEEQERQRRAATPTAVNQEPEQFKPAKQTAPKRPKSATPSKK